MLTLFDQPPYQSHSETSALAAESVRGKTASLREQVYRILSESPLTDEELIERMDISQNTIRPRRVELLHANRITEVDRRRTRSGRLAIVWGVIPE